MKPLLDILAVVVATLMSLVIGVLIGYDMGKTAHRRCNECGSDKYPRSTNGYSGAWRCKDRDGCIARQEASKK